MHRKDFLKQASASALLITTGFKPSINYPPIQTSEGNILTVTGPVPADEMGFTLVHEHLLSIFGTPPEEPAEYDREQVLEEVVPYLKYIKSLGCQTIVDCSAAYLGRNATLLNEISKQSGLKILISTGNYGAAEDRYVPEHAFQETPGQLANRWIDEFENGIQGTDVRPGFMKIGVDSGPLSEIDAKLVRAAAMAHLETGLLMQIHTADNPGAVDRQLAILREEGVSPEAWVWVHAQAVDNAEPLVKAARQGAWISLDGLRTRNYLNGFADSSSTVMHHYNLLSALKREGLMDRILLSHDGSTYPPNGTPKRPLDTLFNTFIPMLKAGGFTDEEIDRLTVSNPARAFRIEVRKI